MKKYTITCSEEQLKLIANMVEDCTRFLSGQCEMWNTTCILKNGREIQDELKKVKQLVTPELPAGASYGWSGAHCPNDHQRKALAMGYGIYRQILHFLSVKNGWNNVYTSPTLTCEEQGGLIKVEEKED